MFKLDELLSELVKLETLNAELLEVLKAIPQLGEPLQPKHYVMINQIIEKTEGEGCSN